MKHIYYYILVLLFLIPVAASAQEMGSFKDRLYYGGTFSLNYGGSSDYTIFTFGVSPTVGYRFTPRFSAGPGIIYQYDNFRFSTYKFNLNSYGGKLFGRYSITENLFAYTEYELLSYEYIIPNYTTLRYEQRRNAATSIYVGGGYSQRIGTNSTIDLLVLYNINHDVNSPYGSPLDIRVGFSFGL